MASFRASAAIKAALPGVPPPAVLEAATSGVAAVQHVEDSFVDVQPVRSGRFPRVTVRFVVPVTHDALEDAVAIAAGLAMVEAVGTVAQWQDLRVYRRVRGRWVELER